MKKLLRVDMEKGSCSLQEYPEKWSHYGGRGLIARILLDEVNPRVHPLAAGNELILATGLLDEYASSLRLSIGGKSPLTGGIKESNVGGMAAQMMLRCGLRCVIISGKPKNNSDLWVLVIEPDDVKIYKASELKGLGNNDTCNKLQEKYPGAAILSIGPAGEYLMAGACIAGTDMDGISSRHAGRGGLGALMGSKGIKAIVLNGGKRKRNDSKRDELATYLKEFNSILLNDPSSGEALPTLGTAMMVDSINGACGLPTRAFRQGRSEEAAHLNANSVRETLNHGGTMGHSCQTGCVIRCSNIYHGRDGKKIVSALEYETIGLMGSNLGIFDLDEVAKLNFICDDVGLDTIETGASIGVLMDMGILSFGDSKGAYKLIQEVYSGSAIGRIIGAGSETTGRTYGSYRVPAVKGQAMPAYDPRTYKGSGVTFATSCMGADHTCGNVLAGDYANGKEKVRPSIEGEYLEMITDILGICRFTKGPILKKRKELLPEFVSAVNGWNIDYEGLIDLCKEILKLESEFNEKAGFGPGQDRIPFFMMEEPLESCDRVFDVTDDDLDKAASILAGKENIS